MSNHSRKDRFTQKMGERMDQIDNEIQMLVDTWNNHDRGVQAFTVVRAATARLGVTVVTSGASYQVLSTDYVVVINKSVGSATGVTLPSSPATGRHVIVKDGKGDAASNNITITPSSGNIDGAANKTISGNYGVFQFVYNGTEWNVLSAS